MKKKNPFTRNTFQVDGFKENGRFYLCFDEDEIANIELYCADMGYGLEALPHDTRLPYRFKVFSLSNPSRYGWISKRDGILYGFYKNKSLYKDRYPITWQIYARAIRRKLLFALNQHENPSAMRSWRLIFGIIDLEPSVMNQEVVSYCISETLKEKPLCMIPS